MTQKVNPSPNRPAGAFKTAGAIAYGGGGAGYIIDGNKTTEIAEQDDDISVSSLNAFDETHDNTSFTVTIEGGEAFVFGSWLATDETTDITIPQSSTEKVYIGWNKDTTEDVIVGTSSAFSTLSNDADQKIEAWEFTTDATGVTSVTDLRQIGKTVQVDGDIIFGDDGATITYDDANDEIEFEDKAVFEDGLNLPDDVLAEFGTDTDFSLKYDSGDNKLKLTDETNTVEKQTWDKNGDTFFPNGDAVFNNDLGVKGKNADGTAVNIAKVSSSDNVEVGDRNGGNTWLEFFSDGARGAYFNQNQNLIMDENDVKNVNAVNFGTGGDIIMEVDGAGNQDEQQVTITFVNARTGSTNSRWMHDPAQNKAFSVQDATDGFRDDFDVAMDGSVYIRNGPLSFANSNNIQDAGTDAITFDGTGKPKFPNGLDGQIIFPADSGSVDEATYDTSSKSAINMPLTSAEVDTRYSFDVNGEAALSIFSIDGISGDLAERRIEMWNTKDADDGHYYWRFDETSQNVGFHYKDSTYGLTGKDRYWQINPNDYEMLFDPDATVQLQGQTNIGGTLRMGDVSTSEKFIESGTENRIGFSDSALTFYGSGGTTDVLNYDLNNSVWTFGQNVDLGSNNLQSDGTNAINFSGGSAITFPGNITISGTLDVTGNITGDSGADFTDVVDISANGQPLRLNAQDTSANAKIEFTQSGTSYFDVGYDNAESGLVVYSYTSDNNVMTFDESDDTVAVQTNLEIKSGGEFVTNPELTEGSGLSDQGLRGISRITGTVDASTTPGAAYNISIEAPNSQADTSAGNGYDVIVQPGDGVNGGKSGNLGLTQGAMEIAPDVEPNAPSNGWALYVDTNDGDKLKAKDAAGNVTTIAS